MEAIPALTEPMKGYLERRGFEVGVKPGKSRNGFYLTTDRPLDEETFLTVRGSPHMVSFEAV